MVQENCQKANFLYVLTFRFLYVQNNFQKLVKIVDGSQVLKNCRHEGGPGGVKNPEKMPTSFMDDIFYGWSLKQIISLVTPPRTARISGLKS